MKCVTLKGINRVGLHAWKGREWWSSRKVRIWSFEHAAFWRPNASGYTDKIDEAGVYEFADAWERTKHCGPEKGISYHTLTSA